MFKPALGTTRTSAVVEVVADRFRVASPTCRCRSSLAFALALLLGSGLGLGKGFDNCCRIFGLLLGNLLSLGFGLALALAFACFLASLASSSCGGAA